MGDGGLWGMGDGNQYLAIAMHSHGLVNRCYCQRLFADKYYFITWGHMKSIASIHRLVLFVFTVVLTVHSKLQSPRIFFFKNNPLQS